MSVRVHHNSLTKPTHHQTHHRDPATKLRTLVLNSGLWSPRYDNADLPRAMPEQHMAWARRQLQAARDGGEKVRAWLRWRCVGSVAFAFFSSSSFRPCSI